jgi:hypothetical protein
MTRMSIRDVSLNGGRRARIPVGTDARWAFGRSGHCGRSELVRISSLSSSTTIAATDARWALPSPP